MISWDFRCIGLVATVFLAAAATTEAKSKPTTTEASVQMLTNFPALQRLGERGDARAIDKYLARVASAYREVGHGDFADALPSARTLIRIFSDPARADTPGALKQARRTLRHLESALAKNPRIVLPAKVGERIPDFYGIAATFTANGDRALKRLKAGKSIANFLSRGPATIWITNLDGTEFAVSNGDVYTYAGGSVSFGSSFSNSSSDYLSGATTLSAGSLSISEVGFEAQYVSIGTQLLAGRWLAFTPDAEIPADLGELSRMTFSGVITLNGVEFPAGMRLVKVAEDIAVPQGAVLLNSPVEVGRPVVAFPVPDPSVDQGGVETFPSDTPTPTPTPSPTPAE